MTELNHKPSTSIRPYSDAAVKTSKGHMHLWFN